MVALVALLAVAGTVAPAEGSIPRRLDDVSLYAALAATARPVATTSYPTAGYRLLSHPRASAGYGLLPRASARAGSCLSGKQHLGAIGFLTETQRLGNRQLSLDLAVGVCDGPSMYQAFGYDAVNMGDPMGLYVAKEQRVSPQEYLKELRSFENQLLKEKKASTHNPEAKLSAAEILKAELKRRKDSVARKAGGRISDNRFVVIDDLPIDMKHFSQTTKLASDLGYIKARAGSYGEELYQRTHEGEGARRSSFSPEDMPSNILGPSFGASRFDPDAPSLADQLAEEFQRISDKGTAKKIAGKLPPYDSEASLSKFDFDRSLTRPAPSQKKIEDFNILDRYLIKRVKEEHEKRKNL